MPRSPLQQVVQGTLYHLLNLFACAFELSVWIMWQLVIRPSQAWWLRVPHGGGFDDTEVVDDRATTASRIHFGACIT